MRLRKSGQKSCGRLTEGSRTHGRFPVLLLIAIMALTLVLGTGCGAENSGTGSTGSASSVEFESVEAGAGEELTGDEAGNGEEADGTGAEGEAAEADGETAGADGEVTDAGAGGQTEPGVGKPGAGTAAAGASAAGGTVPGGKPACTISISCATILNNMNLCSESVKSLVPSDGWILRPLKVELYSGDSAFDVLKRVCRDKNIHMEFSNTPAYGTAYIEGIANIYEFDAGELSGWMYKVNGVFPNYGSSNYEMKDGDTLAWVYTCDLGSDVGGGRATG